MKYLILGTLSVCLLNLQAAQPAPAHDVFARAIQTLGGHLVDPADYPQSVSGFASYLRDSGVETVSAAEMTTPNHPGLAASLGYQYFLPSSDCWSRGAALALLTQKIERTVGEEVTLRNWWRPARYNSHPAVKGAKAGDHPTAHAIDLDYKSTKGRMRAELLLRKLASENPWMSLSLGLGDRTTHVGLGSPRGAREWRYAGWRPAVRA